MARRSIQIEKERIWERWMLLFLLVSGLLSLLLFVVSHLAPEMLHIRLVQAIPGRFINLSILFGPILVLAWLARRTERPEALTLLIVLLAYPFINELFAPPVIVSKLLLLSGYGLLIFYFWYEVRHPGYIRKRLRISLTGSNLALLMAALIFSPALGLRHYKVFSQPDHPLSMSQSTIAFWTQASKSPGQLLTASTVLQAQLLARRPVMINASSLDMVAYAPETVPQMREVLRDIYHIDYDNPDPKDRGNGMIMPGTEKKAWVGRSAMAWRALGERFGFSAVITPERWPLKLTEIAHDSASGLKLYSVFR
ncbi:MAG: hypothetical protein HQL53_13330 [Magnetococcales bacterium]|nr:hypothetical protein [Magnetococcales bacterium]